MDLDWLDWSNPVAVWWVFLVVVSGVNIAALLWLQQRFRGRSRNAQTAAVDPDAVQGLKSAAVPLIMSFSAEQKQEVRSIAHVIGLDQFATQF